MTQAADFDRAVDLCIEACGAAIDHGTPEMQEVARLLLVTIGRELARREAATEEQKIVAMKGR